MSYIKTNSKQWIEWCEVVIFNLIYLFSHQKKLIFQKKWKTFLKKVFLYSETRAFSHDHTNNLIYSRSVQNSYVALHRNRDLVPYPKYWKYANSVTYINLFDSHSGKILISVTNLPKWWFLSIHWPKAMVSGKRPNHECNSVKSANYDHRSIRRFDLSFIQNTIKSAFLLIGIIDHIS